MFSHFLHSGLILVSLFLLSQMISGLPSFLAVTCVATARVIYVIFSGSYGDGSHDLSLSIEQIGLSQWIMSFYL